MANDVVKYDNYMNKLQFKGFTQTDFDLLMAICARMRDLDEEVQVFDYDYIMDLIGWDKTQSVELFHENLKRMNEKLIRVNASIDLNENESVTFVLFTTFRRNKAKRELTVRVNKDFKFVLNELTANFTRFELKEYTSINGRYAKQLYQQIRQRYKQRGHFWQPTLEEIRQALSIPDNYETRRLCTKILEPAVEVIRSCKGLSDLTVETVRSRRRGRAIEGYRFTWTAKEQIQGQMTLDDLQPEQKAGEYKRKKKSRFNDFEQRNTDYDTLFGN